jgi:hypothetical protein
MEYRRIIITDEKRIIIRKNRRNVPRTVGLFEGGKEGFKAGAHFLRQGLGKEGRVSNRKEGRKEIKNGY